MSNLIERLAQRVSLSQQSVEAIVHTASKYGLAIKVNNFDEQGMFFKDQSSKKIRFVEATKEQSLLRFVACEGDVYVIIWAGTIAGWIEQKCVELAGSTMMIVDQSLLHKMPTEFAFTQSCPHMDIHGGFSVVENQWQCAGCGETIFNYE